MSSALTPEHKAAAQAVAAALAGVVKHLPGQHDQATHGGGGGGGGAYDAETSARNKEKIATLKEAGEKWAASLTFEQKNAVMRWGISGSDIRGVQNGKIENPTDLQVALEKEWTEALNSGVKFDGVIYRGLVNVPSDTALGWKVGEVLTINNDQSASYNPEYVKSDFASGRHGVLIVAEQNSGVALFEQTKVTSGGRTIQEYEVVMRAGTSYEIVSRDVLGHDGEWRPDNVHFGDYFQGTGYSLDNFPPGEKLWDSVKSVRLTVREQK